MHRGMNSIFSSSIGMQEASRCGYEFTSPIKAVPKSIISLIQQKISIYGLDSLLEDQNEIKTFTRKHLPDFLELSQRIQWQVENRHRFVVIRQLPFMKYGDDVGSFLLVALLLYLGKATHTGLPEQVKKSIVWKVQPRITSQIGQKPTISQHNEAATLHTDSSYKTHPERYMALLSVNSASDRGGTSIIADGKEVIAKLTQLHSNMQTLQNLKLTYAIPEVFRSDKNEEFQSFPIISVDPFVIRYRHDLLDAGAKLSNTAREATPLLKVFNMAISQAKHRHIHLESGDLLVINNHEILHGRTAFSDMNRLLLRVRISNF